MLPRIITTLGTTLGLVAALAVAPAQRAAADAGDFIGGAIVGGLVGAAIQKNVQTQKQQQRQQVTRTVRPRIAVTEQGMQTQTALNYFGYNAGRVDGQVGPGTRSAIERYQATMGYPINGRAFQPYQYDFLMQAYYWAINGGQAQAQLVGQPLLMSYRTQVQNGTLNTPGQAPAGTTVAALQTEPAGTASLVESARGSVSLTNRCGAVMQQTTANGGFATINTMADPEVAMSEQFCLARNAAITRGESLLANIQGLSRPQVAQQCAEFGGLFTDEIDAVSLRPQTDVTAQANGAALATGISPADLVATSRVCLGVAYGEDDMRTAIASALVLSVMGEPAYGELIGHHLREGFGTTVRRDLAMQWYDASLTAIEAGADPVFMPEQTDRPQLLRAAATFIETGERPARAAGFAFPWLNND
ncbi:MAG: peptidoglycan-binding domain-containing protein [Pseudomonadota bacterium]